MLEMWGNYICVFLCILFPQHFQSGPYIFSPEPALRGTEQPCSSAAGTWKAELGPTWWAWGTVSHYPFMDFDVSFAKVMVDAQNRKVQSKEGWEDTWGDSWYSPSQGSPSIQAQFSAPCWMFVAPSPTPLPVQTLEIAWLTQRHISLYIAPLEKRKWWGRGRRREKKGERWGGMERKREKQRWNKIF